MTCTFVYICAGVQAKRQYLHKKADTAFWHCRAVHFPGIITDFVTEKSHDKLFVQAGDVNSTTRRLIYTLQGSLTGNLVNIYTMLDQRRRRWADFV